MNTTDQTEARETFKHYRGWEIQRHWEKPPQTFSIHKDGWQSYHNFKSLESAKSKIDAIVG